MGSGSRVYAVLLLLGVVLPLARTAACGGTNCPSHTSCSQCTQDTGCGWCTKSKQCFPSDSYGGICAPYTCDGCFRYGVNNAYCPPNNNECSAYHNCQACTNANSGCGWCTATQTCLDSDSYGHVCNKGEYCSGCFRYGQNNQYCAPNGGSCSDFSRTDCASCTNANSACGWCSSSMQCLERDSYGNICNPTDHCDGCFRSGQNTQYCAPAGKHCSNFTTCAQCADASNACGWCSSSHKCLDSNSYGQICYRGDVCDGCFRYGQNTQYCAINNQFCENFHDCQACTANSACGWCTASNTCMPSDSYGNICNKGQYCDGCFVYGPGTQFCPPNHQFCSNYTDCETCTNANQACGWCSATRKCLNSNSYGHICNTKEVCDGCFRYGQNSQFCATNHTQCAKYKDCQSCTSAQTACGWCTSSQKCLPSDSYGNICNAGEYCGDGCFRYGQNNQYCAPSFGHCAQYTSCQSCVTANSACGWCSSSNQCLPRNSYGQICNSKDYCDGTFFTGTCSSGAQITIQE